MARGRRREQWIYWSCWFAIYAAAHGVERSPNYYMPSDLKLASDRPDPQPKLSLRQLAAAQGHKV